MNKPNEKTDLKIAKRLEDILLPNFKKVYCIDLDAHKRIGSLGSLITQLCDFTLENFEDVSDSKRYRNKLGRATWHNAFCKSDDKVDMKSIPRVSPALNKIVCDKEQYKNMVDDLIAVVEKYSTATKTGTIVEEADGEFVRQ